MQRSGRTEQSRSDTIILRAVTWILFSISPPPVLPAASSLAAPQLKDGRQSSRLALVFERCGRPILCLIPNDYPVTLDESRIDRGSLARCLRLRLLCHVMSCHGILLQFRHRGKKVMGGLQRSKVPPSKFVASPLS